MRNDGVTTRQERPEIAALAATVVARIREGHDAIPAGTLAQAVEALLVMTAPGRRFDPADALSTLRALGVADTLIVDRCIPDSARILGDRWLSDEIGFAEVSIATARMQSLVALLSNGWMPDTISTWPSERAALMVLPERETHTLGPHVAAAQLRRLGVSVRLLFAPDGAEVGEALMRDPYDLLLFSCARRVALPFVTETIRHLRQHFRDVLPLSALGGLVVDTETGLLEQTGVDIVTTSVATAVAMSDPTRQTRKAHRIR